MPEKNEKLLVRRAQKNHKYFDILYQKYYDRILHYVKKNVTNEELAKDITADVFEKALKKIDSYQWQGVSFGSWLYRIARNAVYDYYRSARRKRSTGLDADRELLDKEEDLPEEVVLHDERELALFESIASLKEKDQYLLYFRYFEGMSIKEIAVEVNQSEANIATRLHRIRSLIKDFFDDELTDL